MTRVQITESEVLEALEVAASGRGPEEARTIPEIAAASGVSESRTRKALHQMQAAGRLEVHRVVRKALDGRAAIVPAYTITPKRGKK